MVKTPWSPKAIKILDESRQKKYAGPRMDVDARARGRRMLGPTVAWMASWQATSKGVELSASLPGLTRKEKNLA
jgi:hypothetical protein